MRSLTQHELDYIREQWACPFCATRGFYEGPTGGASQNFFCRNEQCGARYNLGGAWGSVWIGELIDPSKIRDEPLPLPRATVLRKKSSALLSKGRLGLSFLLDAVPVLVIVAIAVTAYWLFLSGTIANLVVPDDTPITRADRSYNRMDHQLDQIEHQLAHAAAAKEHCTRTAGSTRHEYAQCMAKRGWKPLGWPKSYHPPHGIPPWNAQNL